MSSNRSLFSYETFGHAVSGSAGSVVAMSVLFPLDTIRSRLQVDEQRKSTNPFRMMIELVEEEGILTLYRGVMPVLSSLCTSNFVYFYTFHGLRAVTMSETHSALKDLCLATVAGAVNVFVTTPLWVVNTRLKFQGANLKSEKYANKKQMHYRGLIDGLMNVAKHEGVHALWSGVMPSLLLTLNPGIQFMVYEAVKRYFQIFYNTNELKGIAYFLIGAFAKFAATVPTYPLQVLQSRLRFAKNIVNAQSKGIMGMLVEIVRFQGIRGLYKGIEAKFIQTMLTSALMFLFYEKIAAFVFRLMNLPVVVVK